MLEDVRPLVDEGFAVHLLRPRSKAPVADGWSKAPVLSWTDLKRRYQGDNNVGVRLGKPSRVDGRYLHVIDLDIRVAEEADDAWNRLKRLLPGVRLNRLPCVQSGSRGESRHLYFVTADPFPSRQIANSGKKFTDSVGKQHWTWEIEVFGTGKQVALPPSIHPDTGKTYRWLNEPDFEIGIPEISPDLIADLVYSGQDEGEEEADTEILGLTYAEAEGYLADLDLDYWCDDREGWRNVGMALHHEFNGSKDAFRLWVEFSKRSRKFELAVCRQQWKSFRANTAKPIRMATIVHAAEKGRLASAVDDLDDEATVAKQAQDAARAPARGRRGDPDMSILQQARIEPPAFPLDIFGKRLAQEVASHALNAAAPVDFVAAAILCGASGVIGNCARVEVKPGFQQTPILWAQIIGPPSAKKSPALRIVTSILNKIESRYEPFYDEKLRKWEHKKNIAEMKLKAWEAKTRAMLAENKDLPQDPPEDCRIPPEPTKRQFILNDLTIEAFMRAQVRNPRGFMMFRDELAGWLGNMERYSAESERGAWLESYDGGSYSIERVKDGNKTIRVRALCAPVMGGIQPERLLDITAQSVVDDGLQARFMPFWPEYRFIAMSEGRSDDTWLTDMFQKLSELSMDTDDHGNPVPFVRKFTSAAFTLFREWSDAREQAEAHVPGRLAGTYGKATGQVARVALILEYLWWAATPDFDDDDETPPRSVGVEAVKAAIRFREDYLKVMQRRVFTHAIESEEMVNARLIANWIVDERVERVSTTQIRREAGIKGMTSHTKSEVVDAAISVLVSAGWLSSGDGERKARGGRPSKNFIVNERIWEILEKNS